MKVSEFKKRMEAGEALSLQFTDGSNVPAHFHVTEFGITTKNFIDCGGKIHSDKKATLQIWVSIDIDHRLNPKSVLSIINKIEPFLSTEDLEIEIEYQQETLSIYQLDYKNGNFILKPKNTECLAIDLCGIPMSSINKDITILVSGNTCELGGGCC